MKNVLPFILTSFLLSCYGLPGRELPVTVDNQTGRTIPTVGVYTMQSVNGQNQPTDSVRLGLIPSATNRVATLNSHRLIPADGGFLLALTDHAGATRRIRFGYFTNGRFLDKGYTLTMKPDTVLIQTK